MSKWGWVAGVERLWHNNFTLDIERGHEKRLGEIVQKSKAIEEKYSGKHSGLEQTSVCHFIMYFPGAMQGYCLLREVLVIGLSFSDLKVNKSFLSTGRDWWTTLFSFIYFVEETRLFQMNLMSNNRVEQFWQLFFVFFFCLFLGCNQIYLKNSSSLQGKYLQAEIFLTKYQHYWR